MLYPAYRRTPTLNCSPPGQISSLTAVSPTGRIQTPYGQISSLTAVSLTGRIQTPYAVDGLSLCWRDLDFYAFPPFSVTSQVLGKVKREGAMGVVVVPRWTTQVWYPLLTRLLIADPVLLPSNAGLLTLPSQPAKKHPLLPQLRLMVCRLSGRGTRDGVSPTLRSSLSGTFLQGCRKPVLRVWVSPSKQLT